MLGDDHHGLSDQDDRHDRTRQKLAEIGMVAAHRGGMLGLGEAAIPGLLCQPQLQAQQGVDEHHGQGRMEQPEPVDGLHGSGLQRGPGHRGFERLAPATACRLS